LSRKATHSKIKYLVLVVLLDDGIGLAAERKHNSNVGSPLALGISVKSDVPGRVDTNAAR
jgi:hypothetical protein